MGKTADLDSKELAPGQTVEVEGSGSKPYTVKNCGGGVWSCTCIAWKMQGKKPTNLRSCKHIASIRGAAAEDVRIAAGAGGDGPTVGLSAKMPAAVATSKADGAKAAAPALLLAKQWEEH